VFGHVHDLLHSHHLGVDAQCLPVPRDADGLDERKLLVDLFLHRTEHLACDFLLLIDCLEVGLHLVHDVPAGHVQRQVQLVAAAHDVLEDGVQRDLGHCARVWFTLVAGFHLGLGHGLGVLVEGALVLFGGAVHPLQAHVGSERDLLVLVIVLGIGEADSLLRPLSFPLLHVLLVLSSDVGFF